MDRKQELLYLEKNDFILCSNFVNHFIYTSNCRHAIFHQFMSYHYLGQLCFGASWAQKLSFGPYKFTI